MEAAIQKNNQIAWTNDQIKLIQDTVAKGTTPDEFKLFLYTAGKYGLDPLVKKIWCVKYGSEPAAIFAGRDGFLQKAHESGKFDGMKTTIRIEQVSFSKKVKKKGYGGKPDEWIEFKKENQLVATCLVWRKDMAHPFEREVWEEEYSSGLANWAKTPRTMIGKVAEAQALRLAFDISGIYSEEESAVIEQSNTIDTDHKEVLSEELQKQIDDCKNFDELSNLWKLNKSLQKKVYFSEAVSIKKLTFQAPVENGK